MAECGLLRAEWSYTCFLGLAAVLSLSRSGAATTHWIVTEDGKIQQQVDSPVNLKHPHDLVIFMRQETTVNYLRDLEKQLVAQKIHIEENEDRDTGLEQRHYKEDPDCIKAKVPLGDLDLYDGTYVSLEDKDINLEDHLDTKSPLPPDLERPDCEKLFALPFSIHGFQHLRGVQERINLTAPLLSKEDPIFNSLSSRLGSIEEIGHRIYEALLKNASSWVLYNIASYYWRMRNEPHFVVECAIRALHFSPRQHKDIALVNMANVLHRAHFSADAAILIHAALDVSTDLLTSHYTLGNIYAMLGEYNHSVLCYEHALQAKPGLEQALKRKHAVLCQQRLEQKLEAQHRSLQRTLNELKEYQKQHDHYLRQQEILEKHKLMPEEQIFRNIIHETQMAKEAQLGNHQTCHLGNHQQSLHCHWDLPVRYHRGGIFESVEYVQFGDDTSTAGLMSLRSDLYMNQSAAGEGHRSSPEARSVIHIWGTDSKHVKGKPDAVWPRRSDCGQTYPTIPNPEELPTHFLPPEKRGMGVQSMWSPTELPTQGVQIPDCSSVSDFHNNETLYKVVKELETRPALQSKIPDDHAKQILFSRISQSLTVEQIGDLLSQAVSKESSPLWLVLNEAGLYWRAVGNSTSALTCLRKALSFAPQEHLDIPLVNLANLLTHLGLHLDASRLLLKALAINGSEPLTYLSLGNTYLAMKNISGALQAFRQSLGLTTRCPECEGSLKLIRCLQFYPFFYNLTSSTCQGDALCCRNGPQPCHDQLKYARDFQEVATLADTDADGDLQNHMEDKAAVHLTKRLEDSASLVLEDVVLAESNSTDESNLEESPTPEEMFALVDELGPLGDQKSGMFEGALEVKGRRVDLQGIRVLKKSSQDGLMGSCYGDCDDDDEAEWITFQVKRMKKPKADPAAPLDSAGKNEDDWYKREGENRFWSTLEISGPKIPSPGPQSKKPDYLSLGWPSPDECLKLRRVELTTVASTWLAVSAKNIDITEHIDFATALKEPAAEPICNANLPASMHTLDHLYGVANRASIHYTGESQLKEVLQNLSKDKYAPQSFEQVGTRISKVLEKNQTSWVLSSMAALYWRVKGQGKKAIDCLRQALHYAPHPVKDVPLISLANILHNAKLWNDAIIVATMAVEIAPHFVVNHFTLANVYVAMEEFEKAMKWYESTLKLQPEFSPAKDRLRTIQCHLLMKKERRIL
ncbi:tetratricopeptide repeat protein 17 [Latimeria chalumnae]